jgi:hypothetical protein
MPPRCTVCGVGDYYSPEHRAQCLMCSDAWWREHHPRATVAICGAMALGFLLLIIFVVSS